MENDKIAEMLKDKIYDVEESRKSENPNDRISTVHLSPEVFLKMAYLFVGIHGK